MSLIPGSSARHGWAAADRAERGI